MAGTPSDHHLDLDNTAQKWWLKLTIRNFLLPTRVNLLVIRNLPSCSKFLGWSSPIFLFTRIKLLQPREAMRIPKLASLCSKVPEERDAFQETRNTRCISIGVKDPPIFSDHTAWRRLIMVSLNIFLVCLIDKRPKIKQGIEAPVSR